MSVLPLYLVLDNKVHCTPHILNRHACQIGCGNNTYSAMASSAHASEVHRKTFEDLIQSTLGFKHFMLSYPPNKSERKGAINPQIHPSCTISQFIFAHAI